MAKIIPDMPVNEDSFLSNRVLLLAWLLVILLEAMIFKAQYSHDFIPIDTDPYMRMVRVETLLSSGDWYNQSIIRSNAPFGEELHWSRALDLLLLVLMLPFSLFFDQHTALQVSGTLISPILKIFSLPALFWAATSLLSRENAFRACFLFLGQWGIIQYDSFARPDHHGLLFLLFILFLGTAIRSLQRPNNASPYFAGLISAISMWVSVESLVSIAAWLFLLLYGWIRDGQSSYLLITKKYTCTLSILIPFFIVIEQPLAALTVPSYDKLSFVHCIVFSALFFQSLLFARLYKRQSTKIRFFMASSSSLVIGVIINYLYPLFFRGPFSNVNTEVVQLWLSKVNEIQPLSFAPLENLNTTILFIGPLVFAAIVLVSAPRHYLFTKVIQENFMLLLLLIFSFLAFKQIRWSPYAEIIILFYTTKLLDRTLERIGDLRHVCCHLLFKAGAYLFFSTGHILLALCIAHTYLPPANITEAPASLHRLNNEVLVHKQAGVILTHINYGPQILYETAHQVIATPYHRNTDGILFWFNTMDASNLETVKNNLRSRNVKYVLIGKKQEEPLSKENPDSFFNRLLFEKALPSWILPITLSPEQADDYILYEVTP